MSHEPPTIEHYMTRSPHVIGSCEPLRAAHKRMREYSIRHLPVVDAGRLVGVVSLSDLHLIETLKDVSLDNTTVAEAMSSPVYEVDSDAPIDRVAAYMANHRIGAAVVTERKEVIGLFTTTDALHALLNAYKRPI